MRLEQEGKEDLSNTESSSGFSPLLIKRRKMKVN
jgi:hypothetical protein